MKYPPFLGKAFVVECLAVEFRCLATRLEYGPDADEAETPIVTFGDEGDGRVRYLAALAPPVLGPETGVVTWHNNYGDWKARPLELADAAWVYPHHVPFAGLAALQRYANEFSFIEEPEPAPAQTAENMDLLMFADEPFVVISPPELDFAPTLGSDLTYEPPVVSYSDGEHEHAVLADAPPEYDEDRDAWHWDNPNGGWMARGLLLSDARWFAPDEHFTDFRSFELYCRGRLGLAVGV